MSRIIKKTIIFLLIMIVFCISSCTKTNNNLSEYPFQEPLEEAYNYCPSIIQLENGTKYVYYCANNVSGVIQDFIVCRKGVKKINGKYSWSEKKVVLSPRYGYYDSFHCCDPSVIEGNFSYKNISYKYLMAYTGNSSAINNKVGLAFSNDYMEGWVHMDEPFIIYNGDKSHWGVGQPSILSIDKKSNVMLYYCVGGSSTYVMAEKWNLKNADKPLLISSCKVTHNGLIDLNGNLDVINNIDVAFDENENRYYFVSDCHPYPTDGEPSFVSSAFRMTYLKEKNNIGDLFESTNSQSGIMWMNIATIGENETGFKRNSNCGIVRNSFGRVIDSKNIEVLYSMSNVCDNYPWTYRIYSKNINIEE